MASAQPALVPTPASAASSLSLSQGSASSSLSASTASSSEEKRSSPDPQLPTEPKRGHRLDFNTGGGAQQGQCRAPGTLPKASCSPSVSSLGRGDFPEYHSCSNMRVAGPPFYCHPPQRPGPATWTGFNTQNPGNEINPTAPPHPAVKGVTDADMGPVQGIFKSLALIVSLNYLKRLIRLFLKQPTTQNFDLSRK